MDRKPERVNKEREVVEKENGTMGID